MKRNNINRLKQLKIKVQDYQELLKNNKAISLNKQRLDLVKRYTELEPLLKEANKGKSYIQLSPGNVWPILDSISSINDTALHNLLPEILNAIERTIAFYGGKRVEIIPENRTILKIIKNNIDNLGIPRNLNKINQELSSINKLIASSEEVDWQKAAEGCRSIIIYLNDQLCKFSEGKYHHLDCMKNNEKNRLIVYLIENRMKADRAKILVNSIYDIGAKGKRETKIEELCFCLVLVYILLFDIQQLSSYQILENVNNE